MIRRPYLSLFGEHSARADRGYRACRGENERCVLDPGIGNRRGMSFGQYATDRSARRADAPKGAFTFIFGLARIQEHKQSQNGKRDGDRT